MRRNSGLAIVFLFSFVCFFVQWFLLGFVFKNLRTLSFFKNRSFFSPQGRPLALHVIAVCCTIASIMITNNWLLPEGTDDNLTAFTMLYVFNVISFVVLISTHYVIGFIIKEKKQ